MQTLQLPDTKQTNQTLTNIQNNKDFRFFYSKIILLKEESLGLQTYSQCMSQKKLAYIHYYGAAVTCLF